MFLVVCIKLSSFLSSRISPRDSLCAIRSLCISKWKDTSDCKYVAGVADLALNGTNPRFWGQSDLSDMWHESIYAKWLLMRTTMYYFEVWICLWLFTWNLYISFLKSILDCMNLQLLESWEINVIFHINFVKLVEQFAFQQRLY